MSAVETKTVFVGRELARAPGQSVRKFIRLWRRLWRPGLTAYLSS